MKISDKLSARATEWLRRYGSSEGKIREADPGTSRLDVAGPAVDAFERLEGTDRLVALRALEPESRSALLRSMHPSVRDATIGGGEPKVLADVAHHDVGPEFNFDWDEFEFAPSGLSVNNARGLAIMAKRAYEDFGADGSDPKIVGQGFEDFARQGFTLRFFGGEATGKGHSTQAFMAIKGDNVIVAFRGTTLPRLEDVVADARFCLRPGYDGAVHEGFADALEEVWGKMAATLEELARKAGKPLKVHVTGHSLGAALTTLAAARLAKMPSVQVQSVMPMGSPRVFDPAAARAYDRALGDRTFRFVNNTDFVTEIPPAKLGYEHVGKVMYFDTKGRLRADTSEAQRQADRGLARWDDGELLKAFRRGLPWTPAFWEHKWDHGPVGYCRHLMVNPGVQTYAPVDAAVEIESYLKRRHSGAEMQASVDLLTRLDSAGRARAIAELAANSVAALDKWLTPERSAAPALAEIKSAVATALRALATGGEP